MIFILLRENGEELHYIAIEKKYSKLLEYEYDEIEFPKSMEIRECNFDVDKRGGLKLVFLNKKYEVKEIPKDKNHILYNVGEFIPVSVYWHEDGMVKLSHLDYAINDILNNKYLKYKNKYVLLNGVVEKVKYSHYISEDIYFVYHIYKILQE